MVEPAPPPGFLLDKPRSTKTEPPPGFVLDQPEQGVGEQASGSLGFLNRGIAQVIGAPVDLANAALGLVGLGSEEPIGGSASIGRGMRGLGVQAARPEEHAETLGQRIGQEVGFAATTLPLLPVAATARGAGFAGRTLRTIGQSAARRPATVVAGEMTAAAGAGAGSRAGEQIATELGIEDTETAEALGALAGGLGAPLTGAFVLRGGPTAAIARRVARSQLAGFTPAGAREQASRRVQTLAGGPEEARRAATRIGRPDVLPEAQISPARQTGNRRLLGLERAVLSADAQLDDQFRQQLTDSNLLVRDELRRLRGPGDVENTREFIAGRRDYILGLIGERAKRAAALAQQRIQALRPRTTDRAQINRVVRDEIENALSDAGKTENQLWQAVPLDVEVRPEATRDALQAVIDDLGRFEKLADLPAEVRRLITRRVTVSGAGRVTSRTRPIPRVRRLETARDLQRARSRILEEARKARAAGDRVALRDLERVQEAILDDLSNAEGVGESYQTALAFSRALNNRFRRGTVGRLLGFRRTGEGSVPAELTLEGTIGTGQRGAGVAVDDIMRAVENAPQTTRAQIEDFIRTTFAAATMPRGEFDPQSARRFIARNESVLDRFPELRRQFEDSAQARRIAETFESRLARTNAALHNRRLSRAALFLDAPVEQEIQTVLRADDPRQAARQLRRMVRRDDTGRAIEGLKAGLLDHLTRRAGTRQFTEDGIEILSGRSLRQQINDPRMQGVLDELLSGNERNRLQRIATTLERIETRDAPDIGGILDPADVPLLEIIARTVGARLGAQAGAGTSGASLLTAHYGAQRARRLVDRFADFMARRSPRQLLIDAVQDPELMQALLRRGEVSVPQQVKDARRLNAWLLSQLGQQAESDNESEQTAPQAGVGARPSRMTL